MRSAKNTVSYATNFKACHQKCLRTQLNTMARSTNYLTSLTDELQHKSRNTYPSTFKTLAFTKVQDLRYAREPASKRCVYRDLTTPAGALANYEPIAGKELSYNNIADSDAAGMRKDL